MSDLGNTFKAARESKGLSIDQIARETRIGMRFLEAIENEQFQVLPGGIFSRGFIRAYAERLSLDAEAAVSEFDRLSSYREPPLQEGMRVSAVPERGKVNRVLYPIAIGALIVIIIIFYVVTRESTTAITAESIAPPAATSASDPIPLPAPVPSQELTPPPATAPAQPADDALTMVIEVTAQSWIKVLGDGNSVLAQEVLEPGMTRRYTAQSSIGLTVGNAGGLRIRVNDRDIPPLGKSGQVRSITITPESLKNIIG